MHMYVCICVCMCVFVFVRVCVYMCVCLRVLLTCMALTLRAGVYNIFIPLDLQRNKSFHTCLTKYLDLVASVKFD